MPFPPSELFLNADQSVYHLNLHPEDLADIVLTVGDPDRVPLVSSMFDSVELKKQKREFVTHTGHYRGKRITVLSSGIGTDNVEIVFHELDALVNIDLGTRTTKEKLSKLKIIRVGTSGALQSDIPTDSHVFSKFGLGLDGLLNFYQTTQSPSEEKLQTDFIKYFGQRGRLATPYVFRCSEFLENKIGVGMTQGITVTCPGFYAPQGRVLRYRLAFDDLIDVLPGFQSGSHRITNFEMETSAMYGLGKILGHEVCAVNVIVANRITREVGKKYEESMRNLVGIVLDGLTSS